MKEELIKAAQEAMNHAYTPYSKFNVGAAILSEDGKIYTGCNIENASYGLTNCAERTAIFKAVSEGVREFKAMAVVGNTDIPISPCGACRQVLSEFATPNMIVFLANTKGESKDFTVEELLPYSFSLMDKTDNRKED